MNFIDVDVSSPKFCDHFNILIERHIYLIQMAKKLAEAINFVLLMQLLISSILLCIMGKHRATFFIASRNMQVTSREW